MPSACSQEAAAKALAVLRRSIHRRYNFCERYILGIRADRVGTGRWFGVARNRAGRDVVFCWRNMAYSLLRTRDVVVFVYRSGMAYPERRCLAPAVGTLSLFIAFHPPVC